MKIFKKFAIRRTPTTLVLDGDGAEVGRFIGYRPPAESFQLRLEKILNGRNIFESLLTTGQKVMMIVGGLFVIYGTAWVLLALWGFRQCRRYALEEPRRRKMNNGANKGI